VGIGPTGRGGFGKQVFCETHLGLQKETPLRRAAASRNGADLIVSRPRLGVLHHGTIWLLDDFSYLSAF